MAEKQRTSLQNKSLHLYFEMVAHELENQGQTMTNIIAKLPLIEITPTKNSIKELLWKPIAQSLFGKKSTTELTTAEITQVYEVMAMFLAKEFSISLPFPNQEETTNYLNSYENN